MGIMDDIMALTRRVQQLEANRGASLRFCEVTGVSKDGHARVRLLDGDGMVTNPLRILQRRTLKDQEQCFPDIGEHVACLFSGQGLEQGVILGAMYSAKNAAPHEECPMAFYRFEDGTVLSYDREAHKLVADIQGEAEVTATKTVIVEALEGIEARTPKKLVLEGRAGVEMRGPTIRFEGIEGEDCETTINASMKIRGDIDQEGSQRVSNSITAGGTITGSPVVGCVH